MYYPFEKIWLLAKEFHKIWYLNIVFWTIKSMKILDDIKIRMTKVHIVFKLLLQTI